MAYFDKVWQDTKIFFKSKVKRSMNRNLNIKQRLKIALTPIKLASLPIIMLITIRSVNLKCVI